MLTNKKNGRIWCLEEVLHVFSKFSMPQRALPMMDENDIAIIPLEIESSFLVKWFLRYSKISKRNLMLVDSKGKDLIYNLSSSQQDYISLHFKNIGASHIEIYPYYMTENFTQKSKKIREHLINNKFSVNLCPSDTGKRNIIENKSLFHPKLNGEYDDFSFKFIKAVEGTINIPKGYCINSKKEFNCAVELLKTQNCHEYVLKKSEACSGLDIYYGNIENRNDLSNKIIDGESWVVEENLTSTQDRGIFFSIQYQEDKIIEEPFIQETIPKLMGVYSSYSLGISKVLLDSSKDLMNKFFNHFKPEWFGSVDFYFNMKNKKLYIIDINYGRLTLTHIVKNIRRNFSHKEAMISCKFYKQDPNDILKNINMLSNNQINNIIPVVFSPKVSLICFIELDMQAPFKLRDMFDQITIKGIANNA